MLYHKLVFGCNLIIMCLTKKLYLYYNAICFVAPFITLIFTLVINISKWYNRQFARVVKGVDLRSTAGICAWVQTPQLTLWQCTLHIEQCLQWPQLLHIISVYLYSHRAIIICVWHCLYVGQLCSNKHPMQIAET